MGELSNWLTRTHTEAATYEIAQKVADTLGPNPCERLHWQEGEDGDITNSPCNSKRCHDCGPYKQLELELQIEAAYGKYCYIEVFTTRDELDTTIERVRKQAKRDNADWLYTITGDDYLGWILTSNRPLTPSGTLKTLADWLRRIVDGYRYGDGRLRRSRALSRLTVGIRKTKSGQPSIWRLVTRKWVPLYAIPDTVEELIIEIETEHYFKKRDLIAKHRKRAFVSPADWVDPA